MKSYCWFERCDAVRHWIQAAIEKCKIYIQNAIADDSPVPVTDSVNYSTSAHHTEGFLCQIGNFWKNLDWPEPLTSSFYVVMVVKGIADCTIYYISEMVNRLDCIEEIFDERGNIKVNPKVKFNLKVEIRGGYSIMVVSYLSLDSSSLSHILSLSLSL